MPILLLDPNADSRNALAELLRIHGYEVVEAACEEEAVGRAAARLLLVDIGFSNVQILRRLRADGRVAAVALGTQPRLRAAALENGFAEYLLKPLAVGTLLTLVERLIGAGTRRDQ